MEDLEPARKIAGSEPRGARRKRETRARLLQAALRMMAEKGMEGVAISEITEAADVGFGSFYNHFQSKQAIYEAVVDAVFEEFGVWLDGLTAATADPAEVVAIAVRHTLRRALADRLWGQFLVREALAMRSIDRGLGRRLMHDIHRGIEARRFSASDPFMSFISVGGMILLSIAAGAANVDNKDLPERAAAAALKILGLDEKQAGDIARRPLPAS